MPKAKIKRSIIKEQIGLSVKVVLSGQKYLAVSLYMSRIKGLLTKSVVADQACINSLFDPLQIQDFAPRLFGRGPLTRTGSIFIIYP
jgi:hypothetical protein